MARILLSEQTADRIEKLIGEQYSPGDKIPPEMELAEFMEVSRTTIREAVKILCSRHILEIRRGSGTFVCENPGMPADPLGSKDMDIDQVRDDIFEMSKLLEPELIRLSAIKADPESVRKMKDLDSQMQELLKRYRGGQFVKDSEFRKLDVAFHRAVIDGCGNRIITRSVPMFLSTCREWYDVWSDLDKNKVLESFEKYHPMIIEAVEAHDGDSAYRYAMDHTLEIIELYKGGHKNK